MKVKIEEVQNALNTILNDIKERGDLEIEVSEDYYWNIPKDDLYKMESQPNELTIGSLSDDLEEIGKINSKAYSSVAYNLSKVSAVLRYISENVS